MPTPLPVGLPLIARGRHASAADGACFMELASILAGERFTDHPQTAHPVLAAVARTVNDLVSDDCRTKLVTMVPDVIGTARAGAAVDPALVGVVASAALSVNPQCKLARRVLRAARRRIDRLARPGGLARRRSTTGRGYYQERAARHAAALTAVVARAGDDALYRLLHAVITECRAGLPNRDRPVLAVGPQVAIDG